MEVGSVRVADDGDFALLRRMVDARDGWRREYSRADGSLSVWTRGGGDPDGDRAGCAHNFVKVIAQFNEVSPQTLYDVLHDPHYRPQWDTHMLCSEDIGYLNINNDVGYYAMSCPSPMKNRDFVLQRSWLDTGAEQMIINHSVFHKDYPPRPNFIRAISHLTGFLVRPSEQSAGGSILGYVSQTDPQGKLPAWLVNTVTHNLAPRLAKKLEKAALAYPRWKSASERPDLMPWRYPDQVQPERITVADCVNTVECGSKESIADATSPKKSGFGKKKKSKKTDCK